MPRCRNWLWLNTLPISASTPIQTYCQTMTLHTSIGSEIFVSNLGRILVIRRTVKCVCSMSIRRAKAEDIFANMLSCRTNSSFISFFLAVSEMLSVEICYVIALYTASYTGYDVGWTRNGDGIPDRVYRHTSASLYNDKSTRDKEWNNIYHY